MIEDVVKMLKELRLKNCAENIRDTLDEAGQKNLSPLQTIERLLALELEARRKSRIAQRFKQSKLDERLTIDQFDFKHHESRQRHKNLILRLLDLEFVQQKGDIILIGNPGVGKTFLAKCVGYAATQAGIRTLFTTTMDMVNHLIAANADHSLLKKLHYYQSQDVLAVDELGYLPLGRQGSNLFFQVISARHKKKSTIITTNLPFAKWGKVFGSTTVATAIADRLVHNSEILILEGPSYRKRS